MSNFPQRWLRELLDEHGAGLGADPQRLRALLAELCPRHPREVDAIVRVAEWDMVPELRADAGADWPGVSAPLVRRLTGGGSLTDAEAIAALQAWAQALELTFRNAPFQPLESLEELEERREAEAADATRRATRAGRRSGALVGFVVATYFGIGAVIVNLPPTRRERAVTPLDWSWAYVAVAAAAVGYVIGSVVGPWAGRTQVAVARMAVGAVVGALCGVLYHAAIDKLFQKLAGLSLGPAPAICLGILLGVISGCLLGLLTDHRPLVSRDTGERLELPDE